MADYDRYLAACEDRHAARLLDREEEIYRCTADDEAERARREDAYVKMLNCPDCQRMMGGLPPEGYAYNDEGELVEVDGGDDDWECDQDRDREMEDR